MASEKITAIIDAVAELSVLELSELVKEVEERFGVSAAAAVAVAAPVAGEAAAQEEKTEFDVVLESFDVCDNLVATGDDLVHCAPDSLDEIDVKGFYRV